MNIDSGLSAQALERRLLALRNPARAAGMTRFFKCGEGEYGAGDKFLGIAVPPLRSLTREFRRLPLAEIEALLASEWHEVRLVALLIAAHAYRSATTAGARAALYRLYLEALRRGRINNWDLVDASCEHVVGAHLQSRDRAPLQRMARSADLWTRRVAIVSTFAFIKAGEADETLRIASLLLGDRHDLIHKATGWMVREVGKRVSEPALRAFLEQHAATMPRTMLRYAIERLDERSRRHFLGLKAARAAAGQPAPFAASVVKRQRGKP